MYLVDVKPSESTRVQDAFIFYFGVRRSELNGLPGKSEFQVVYSPKDGYGWEYVYYRVFENQNGMSVVERRSLEPEEVVYFQQLIANTKFDTGTASAVESTAS